MCAGCGRFGRPADLDRMRPASSAERPVPGAGGEPMPAGTSPGGRAGGRGGAGADVPSPRRPQFHSIQTEGGALLWSVSTLLFPEPMPVLLPELPPLLLSSFLNHLVVFGIGVPLRLIVPGHQIRVGHIHPPEIPMAFPFGPGTDTFWLNCTGSMSSCRSARS